jgi:hypothetical protein
MREAPLPAPSTTARPSLGNHRCGFDCLDPAIDSDIEAKIPQTSFETQTSDKQENSFAMG